MLRRTASTETTHYLHQDHLGSTDIVTDATGGIVERLSYDPHGLRRASDWQDATGAIASSCTTRGFTGHEHLDSLKLVHMNGRVYDPVIGRFLSTDPAYQNLAGSQALNRYAYVLNNPLSYTDPTGYFFKKIFKAVKRFVSSAAKTVKKAVAKVGKTITKALAKNEIVRVAVVIAVTAITQQYYLAYLGTATATVTEVGVVFYDYTAASHIAAAAISGGVSGLIASDGDLKPAAISAVTAIAFVGVGEALGHASGQFGSAQHVRKIAAHAVVGGTSAELQGGKFAHGALSAGFGQVAAPAINGIPSSHARVAAAAVAGGIGATLGGGKFANGAITSAFGRLYNDESHNYKVQSQLCYTAETGCTVANLAALVEPLSLPFANSAGSCVYRLLESNPVDHSSWFGTDGAFYSINKALPGHRYFPGEVLTKLYPENGVMHLTSTGSGSGAHPIENTIGGYILFSKLHSIAKLQVHTHLSRIREREIVGKYIER